MIPGREEEDFSACGDRFSNPVDTKNEGRVYVCSKLIDEVSDERETSLQSGNTMADMCCHYSSGREKAKFRRQEVVNNLTAH